MRGVRRLWRRATAGRRGTRAGVAAGLAVATLGGLLVAPAPPAAAAVTVTPATGGEAIPATTAATGGSGQYTALTGPTIAETSASDIAAGTVIIDAPAGFAFDPVGVVVSDVGGAVAPGTITLAPDAAGCATPAGSTTVTPTATSLQFQVCAVPLDDAHKATLQFTGLAVRPTSPLAGTAGSLTLDPSSAAIAGVTSLASLAEVPGPTAQLAISALPVPGPVAGDPFGFSVTSEDAVGNATTGYGATVAFSSNDPNATLPGPVTFTGQSTVAVSGAILRRAGATTVGAADTAVPLLAGSTSVTVAPGATAAFVVGGVPSPLTAGTPATASVAAVDAFGNATPAYTGTVALTSSDPHAALPAPYTFTAADAGAHGFGVTLVTSGAQSVSAAQVGGGPSGVQSGIEVGPAGATTLELAAPPAATAGTPVYALVTARDAYGNTATGYTGTVQLSSSDARATLPTAHPFAPADAGQHVFSPITFGTAGAETLSAGDGTLAATPGSVAVAPGAAASFVVDASSTSSTAGAETDFTVAARDAYGNTATGFTGTVTLSSTDPQAVLPPAYTFTSGPVVTEDNGVHTFTVALRTAGPQSLTVTLTNPAPFAPVVTGTSALVDVVAGPATSLTVGVSPTTVTAGAPLTATVSAHDAYGNVAAGFAGSIVLSSSDAQAVVPTDPSATGAGITTFTGVVLKTAGSQSVSATSGLLYAVANGITVVPAATAVLHVAADPATVTAGRPVSVTVSAFDGFGNATPAYTGTVGFTSSDPHATLPAAYAFQASDTGSRVFAATLTTAGSQTITAADTTNPLAAGTTAPVIVDPAPTATLELSGMPASSAAGSAIALTVTALDPFGNVATAYAGTVHVTSTDTHATLPGNDTFTTGSGGDNGVHRFTVVLGTVGSQTLTVADATDPTLTVTSAADVVTPGPVAALALAGIPTPLNAETAVSLTVTAEDTYQNVVPDYAGSVHFHSTDALASLPPDYTFVPASDVGSHLFSAAVVLRNGGTQTVTATDAAGVTGSATTSVVLSGSLTLAETNTAVSLPPVTLNGLVQLVPGGLAPIQIDDGRAGALGWSVTATLSDLTVAGYADANHIIPAGDVSWDPGANGGCHPVDLTGTGTPAGLQTGVSAGPGGLAGGSSPGVVLDSTRPMTLCSARPGTGMGLYEDQPNVEVRIDPWKAAGTYQGTLTITGS